MSETLVFGHKNPDTDSICSALSYAKILNESGTKAKACRLGKISKETQYILDYLEIEAPELLTSVNDQEVVLVDHNEFGQSVDGIENANIIAVIDHHRVANFHTSGQVLMNIQPVGCTATVLYDIVRNKGITLDKTTATLMLSAIVSDTLLFKSPTCTRDDVFAAEKLNDIAGLDIEKYGLDLLKAGTDLSGFTASELLNIDAKKFTTSNGLFEVAQINVVNIDEFLQDNEKELLVEIDAIIADKSLDCFIVMITDILNSNSLLLIKGPIESKVADAFNVELTDNKAFLEGIVSRKKQIVPFL